MPATALAGDEVPALDEAGFIAALERADPRFERLDAEVAVSDAEVVVAGLRPNPELAVEREQLLGERGSATSYVRLGWQLDLAGRRGRRVAVARSVSRAAAAEAEAARARLVVEGLRVFHDAAHARVRVELLRAHRDALVRAADVVEKRREAGAGSGYDARRVALELAAYDALIDAAETERDAARGRLGALIGVGATDADADLELADPPPLDRLLADAVDTRGDHRAARLRAEAADGLDELGGRGWIPDLGLSVGGMAAEGGDDLAFGYTVGVTLSVPMLDRGQGEHARARALRRLASAEARTLEHRVPAEVRIAHHTLVRRLAQVRRLGTEQLGLLDGLLRSAETAYREGETGVVELLDAHRAVRDTRLRDLELRRDARQAELDLWLALGRRP